MKLKSITLYLPEGAIVWRNNDKINICYEGLSDFIPKDITPTDTVVILVSDQPILGSSKSYKGYVDNWPGSAGWFIQVDQKKYNFYETSGLHNFLTEWVRENGNNLWFRVHYV